MFYAEKVFPGVTHISDAMGVSMTLIEGKERAILFDTGYGTENVKAFIQTLTGKPVSVLLSHQVLKRKALSDENCFDVHKYMPCRSSTKSGFIAGSYLLLSAIVSSSKGLGTRQVLMPP